MRGKLIVLGIGFAIIPLLVGGVGAAEHQNFFQGFFISLGIEVAYFLPTLIASLRGVPNTGSILILNLFLGWTFIGWVVALAMSARSKPAPFYYPGPVPPRP